MCGSSDMVSSAGLGRRACATARGPTCLGKNGAAIAARTTLERTVVGRMFPWIFSGLTAPMDPNTMFCTLLKILRHVLKDSEWGLLERSYKWVWNVQKVWRTCKLEPLDVGISPKMFR